MGVNPKQVIANEIDPERAQSLSRQGYRTTAEDATTYRPNQQVDIILANPPFGSVRDFDSDNPTSRKEWNIAGHRTRQIDHAICLNALSTLKDDGKAILIIGGVKGGDPKKRSSRYNTLTNRGFFKTLHDNYNVTDHISLDGKLYQRPLQSSVTSKQ